MARLQINELPVDALPSTGHEIPAIKDGVTTKLTINQILGLVIGSAGAALDTLEELADALGNDADFAATMTAALALKMEADDLEWDNILSKPAADWNALAAATSLGLQILQSVDAATVRGLLELASDDDVNFASLTSSGSMIASNVYSGVIAIESDAAGVVTPPTQGGFCSFTASGQGDFPQISYSGIILYDVGSSNSILKVAGGPSFEVLDGNVTGTTGTDNRITIGHNGGSSLKVENRYSGALAIQYFFFGA